MCTNFEYQMRNIYEAFKGQPIDPKDLLHEWDTNEMLIIKAALGGIAPEQFIEDMRQNGYLRADEENRFTLTVRGEKMLDFVAQRVGST